MGVVQNLDQLIPFSLRFLTDFRNENTMSKLLILTTTLISSFFIHSTVFSQSHTTDQAEAEWDKHPNYSQTKIIELESLTVYKKTIPLTVVLLKNSKWPLNEAIERIRRTEEIFMQCELAFSPINIIHTHHKNGHNIDTENGSGKRFTDVSSLINKGILQKTIIFMADSDKASIVGSAGIAWIDFFHKGKPHNRTGIIFHKFAQYPWYSASKVSKKIGYFEVFAHELAHILFDQPHIKSHKNLLSGDYEKATNYISPSQCLRIKDDFFNS